jgi:hypothetical protein
MRSNRRATLPLSALLAVLALGGCSNDFFVCSQDSECTEEAGGRCEPSGSCSFPDLECPTGRRYGKEGNPQVAGTCVPASDIGSTGLVETDAGTSGDITGSGSGDGSSTGSVGGSTGSTGDFASTGGESSSGGSSSGGGSSSTGEEIPVRELFQPCTTATQDVDCPNSVCVEFMGDVSGGFCAQTCRDTSDCYDPGVGAPVRCVITNVNGTSGGSCVLDCSEPGVDGCIDGMSCSPQAMFPDDSILRVCYWP